MTAIRSPRLVTLIALAMLLVGCHRKVVEQADPGTWQNSVYQNKYFGASITFPADWYPDQAAMKRIMHAAEANTADQKQLALIKASEQQTVYLFLASKYPPDQPAQMTCMVMAQAETVPNVPGKDKLRGKDYLVQLRRGFGAGLSGLSFPKDIFAERLAGVDFDVLTVTRTVGRITIVQEYYATIVKGYALCFLLESANDDDHATEKAILDTLTFGQ